MLKKSAVVVLYEQSTDSLILTQRSISLRDHPGEICFPGGKWALGDKSLWSTALRELQEELGIEPSRVKLVKALTEEKTLLGTIIYPWFATIPTLYPYSINPDEVATVLTLPMQEVTKISHYKEMTIERYGQSITCCQYLGSKHFVWGATARIMKQLCL